MVKEAIAESFQEVEEIMEDHRNKPGYFSNAFDLATAELFSILSSKMPESVRFLKEYSRAERTAGLDDEEEKE